MEFRFPIGLKKNLALRLPFILFFLLPILFYKDFFAHMESHFTGSVLPRVITGQWHIVIINIILFLTFLIPLSFRRKVNWKEYGLVTAFFVSLFVEMYGIPFLVIFVSHRVHGSEVQVPGSVLNVRVLGVELALTMTMVYGTVLMIIGTLLIILGWITLYRNLRSDDIVTKGIYSYSRHPQYFGFILIILGWLIGWPTILTFLFAIILIYKYVKVCRIEERELSQDLKYLQYRKNVPFFI